MEELTINLHMHTTYSDGSGSHKDLGAIALETGVDVLIVTDHNVLVEGLDAYYRKKGKNALVLVCEEIHDQDRVPQKNHLLVFGADRELSTLADDPQSLIDAVRDAGGRQHRGSRPVGSGTIPVGSALSPTQGMDLCQPFTRPIFHG